VEECIGSSSPTSHLKDLVAIEAVVGLEEFEA